jgi:hypothetical protein
MYKTIINNDDGSLDNGAFIIAIQLSRIVNTLRSNFRAYLDLKSDTDMMIVKDRLDLMLVHGAMPSRL